MTRPRVRKMISVPKRKRREPEPHRYVSVSGSPHMADGVYRVSPAGTYPVISRFSYTDPDTGEVYAGTMVDEAARIDDATVAAALDRFLGPLTYAPPVGAGGVPYYPEAP